MISLYILSKRIGVINRRELECEAKRKRFFNRILPLCNGRCIRYAAIHRQNASDILLNPDSSVWIKRMGEGFKRVGEMSAPQTSCALNTIAAWCGTY